MSSPPAHVSLVGAGPGDPGLITVRGLQLLRDAEVVLYDRLIDPRLVDEAPAQSERVYVGKTPGGPSKPQAEIDALIVDRARAGKRVVRLKGGDPFLFGRGADEAQALVAAGIAFEIVPGVTSAIAVPAYAGIPVTHSGASSSMAVLTAHESSPRPDSQERWNDVARGAGTLILLMGVAGLEETTRRVIEAGRDPKEPSAVIERGTTHEQRTIVAPLDGLAEAARAAAIGSPAVTILGQVVRLRDALSWFDTKPLFGRRVILTRESEDATELRARLEALGADVVLMPLVSIQPLASLAELDSSLAEGGFDWVVFSSRNAARVVAQRLRALRLRLPGPAAAVGAATAKVLEDAGLSVELIPDTSSGEGLAEALGGGAGRVLLPVPQGRTSRAAEELERRGWDVAAVAAYRNVAVEPGEWQRQVVESASHDAILFASGSAVESFMEAFDDLGSLGLSPGAQGQPKVVAIGPSTAASLSSHGLRVDATAQRPTPEAVVEALLGVL